MKEATKQRIVGTVVLLALGLIFLPIIFDGEGSYQAPVSSRIPNPPSVPILPEPEPNRPRIIAESLPVEDTPADSAIDSSADSPASSDQAATVDSSANAAGISPDQEEAQAEDTEADNGVEVVESVPDFQRDQPEIPQLGEDGLPQGWVVRLGTFANGTNAANLVTRLQDSGYKAYSRNVVNEQGTMTAVFVGPWLQREQVEDFQLRLQEQFQLSGMIVRYEIEAL